MSDYISGLVQSTVKGAGIGLMIGFGFTLWSAAEASIKEPSETMIMVNIWIFVSALFWLPTATSLGAAAGFISFLAMGPEDPAN